MQNESFCPLHGKPCASMCGWYVVEAKIDDKVKGGCALAILAKDALIRRRSGTGTTILKRKGE